MLETALNSIYAVLIIVFMIGLGWLFGKLGYIGREHKKLFIKLIISVGMPALVVNNFFGKLDFSTLERPFLFFLLPVGSMLLMLLLGILLAAILKPEKKRRGTFIVLCAFSNSLYIGLPMCAGLFGDAAIPYVMCFYIVNTTLFWTVGNYLISKSGGNGRAEAAEDTRNAGDKDNPADKSCARLGNKTRKRVKKEALNTLKRLFSPPLIAIVISLPLFAFGVKLPQPIIKLSGYIGNIVTPLALFYIGYALYEYGFKSLKPDKATLAVLFMRFIAAPAIMLGLCFLLDFKGMPAGVMLIEASMPVMTNAAVLAASYDADESFAAGCMSLSTLVSCIVVPLLMLLMRALKMT